MSERLQLCILAMLFPSAVANAAPILQYLQSPTATSIHVGRQSISSAFPTVRLSEAGESVPFKQTYPAITGGETNHAMKFNGVNTYIEIAQSLAAAAVPTKEMTVEAWVKPESLPVYGGFIGAFQDNNTYQKGWVLGNAINHFCFGLATTGANDGNGLMTYVQAPAQTTIGRWYHIAGVYDGSVMKLYVNGQVAATSSVQSGAILYDSTCFFDIGAYHDSNELTVFKGSLDEVRLWNSALTQDQIRSWMFKTMDPTHPNYTKLISCWNFNDGAGAMIRDMTGKNPGVNHGLTLSNNVVSTAPIGTEGAYLNTQSSATIGSTGASLQVLPSSTLSSSNFLGIYLTGVAAGDPVSTDVFPSTVQQRSNLTWGFWQQGVVTGSAGLSYAALIRGGTESSLRLLYRKSADTSWQDVTESQYQDKANHQFIISGPLPTGSYAIGWEGLLSSTEGRPTGVPMESRLYQNFPNPGNPSTTLRFDLDRTGAVDLVIYNVLGQRVKVLLDEVFGKGKHATIWDMTDEAGRAVSSGTYVCALTADGRSQTIKIVVMR